MIRKVLILLLIGVAYVIFIKLTDLGIPCIFHSLTHLYCPGCGISRMFLYLAGGDIVNALSSNIAVFVLSPLFVFLSVVGAYKYVRYDDTSLSKLQTVLLFIILITLLVFGVLRNVFPIDLLIP